MTTDNPSDSAVNQPSLFDSMVENDQGPRTDIVPQEQEVAEETSALASFSGTLAFDASDLVFPRIRLAQSLTAEVTEGAAKAGQFVIAGAPPADVITVVPGLFTRRRIYANPDTQDVLCRSNDAVSGVGTPGGPCDQCPFSHWSGSQEERNRKPPACTFMYSYIVFVEEWQTLGILDFRKTSLNTGKTVNTMAARYGLGNFAFQLKSVSQTNTQKQRYFIMTVTPIQADDALLDTARQFFKM